MTETSERRALNRIEILSAEVFYKPIKRLSLLSTLTGPTNLINISKSGACFISKNSLEKGSEVMLKLFIPEQDPFFIKAKTVWIATNQGHSKMSVGVQFKPFGKGKGYNSFKSKEILAQLYTAYNNKN